MRETMTGVPLSQIKADLEQEKQSGRVRLDSGSYFVWRMMQSSYCYLCKAYVR